MKKLILLFIPFLSACVYSDIKHVPCNEISQDICKNMGDRIFVINCNSSAVGSEGVRDKCIKDIAIHVNDLGFDYFVMAGSGDTYSQDYSVTTREAVTTNHNYNINTTSNTNVYGSGRLAGYSARGYGNSNTNLSGSSTTYVPVTNNYTVTTNTYQAFFMPIEQSELKNLSKYYKVSDYVN